jgi:hypothetical protein
VQLSSAVAELTRRRAVPNLMNACFDKQVAFINDTSRRKAAFVPRRSGKSWSIAVKLIKSALEAPATKCLYYGLTKESAWNVLYLHRLYPICRQFGIRYKANTTMQTLEFENQSVIKLTGDDATPTQIDKALGGKYKLVVFDECQSIKHDLDDWVNNKLGPAMVDLDGTIVLAGTAGDYMGDHYWYRVTRQEERAPGWSVHEWTPFDNPFMADRIRAYLDERRRLDPELDQDPGYQREWLNKWVVERDARIYRYDPLRNAIDSHLFDGKLWRYIIGVDFGWEDPTAIVVGAYHPHDERCYIIESFKQKHMHLKDVEAELKWRISKYSPEQIVVDGQAAQFQHSLAAEMGARYGIPMRPAQKLGKAEHIAAMNTDFRTGKIKVVKKGNEALVKEWDELVWDEKSRVRGIFKESPSKDNHLADACLYLHHASKQYWSVTAPVEDPHPMRTKAERELKQQLGKRGDVMGFYDELERVG